MGNVVTARISVGLADFNAAWPEGKKIVAVEEAVLIMEKLLTAAEDPLPQSALKKAIYQVATCGELHRKDVVAALGLLRQVKLTQSLQCEEEEEEEEAKDPRVLDLQWTALDLKELLSLLTPAVRVLLLTGNKTMDDHTAEMGRVFGYSPPPSYKGISFGSEFFQGIETIPLQELHLDLCNLTLADVGLLGKYAAAHPSLEVLNLRRVHIGYASDVDFFPDLQSSRIRSLDVSECGLNETSCIAEYIKDNKYLKTLKVSGNKFGVTKFTKINLAIYDSRVEHFEARSVDAFGGGTSDLLSWSRMICSPHLISLDIRGQLFDQYKPSEYILEGLRQTSSLYRFKVDSLPPQPLLQLLRSNETLGILSFRRLDLSMVSEKDRHIGDNLTLFSLDGACGNAGQDEVLQQIKANWEVSSKVRKLIYMVLASRYFHRDESGHFACLPKEIMVLICKELWSTRRERNLWRNEGPHLWSSFG
jgi:hypothetical protein